MARVVAEVNIGTGVRLVIGRNRNGSRVDVFVERWVKPRAKGNRPRWQRVAAGDTMTDQLRWLRDEIDVVLGFQRPGA